MCCLKVEPFPGRQKCLIGKLRYPRPMIVAIESYQTHKHRSKNDSGLHGRWISQTRSFSFTEGSLISDKLTIRQSIAASSSLGSHATLVLLLYDFCRPSKLPMSKYSVVTDCKSNESYPAFISSKIALNFFFGYKIFTQNRTVAKNCG